MLEPPELRADGVCSVKATEDVLTMESVDTKGELSCGDDKDICTIPGAADAIVLKPRTLLLEDSRLKVELPVEVIHCNVQD